MHVSGPALVFEEKSGEKKGSYYASKCSELSRRVCLLSHSKDQLQRITPNLHPPPCSGFCTQTCKMTG